MPHIHGDIRVGPGKMSSTSLPTPTSGNFPNYREEKGKRIQHAGTVTLYFLLLPFPAFKTFSKLFFLY